MHSKLAIFVAVYKYHFSLLFSIFICCFHSLFYLFISSFFSPSEFLIVLYLKVSLFCSYLLTYISFFISLILTLSSISLSYPVYLIHATFFLQMCSAFSFSHIKHCLVFDLESPATMTSSQNKF